MSMYLHLTLSQTYINVLGNTDFTQVNANMFYAASTHDRKQLLSSC